MRMADRSAAFSVQFDPETALDRQNVPLQQILRCRNDLRPSFGKIVLLLVCCVLAAGSVSLVPLYLGNLIDVFVDSMIDAVVLAEYAADVAVLLRYALPVAVLLVIHAVFSYAVGRLAAAVSSAYCDRMRRRVFHKILRVRMEYLDVHAKTSIHDTATQQIDVIGQSVNLLLSKALCAVILLAALVLSCLRVGVMQSVFLLVVILLYALIRLFRASFRRRPEDAPASFSAAPDVRQTYQNLAVLHVSGRLRTVADALMYAQSEHLQRVRRTRFTDELGRCCAMLLVALAVAAALLRDAYSGEAVRIGALLSFVLYIRRLESPLTDVSFFASSLHTMAAGAQTLYTFLDAPEETGGGEPIPSDGDGRCRIAFRKVCFAYDQQTGDVLHDLSFTVQDRGMTVLRGETGAGKTTILKLLTGFYRPQAGDVALNGVSVSQFDPQTYRDLFAVLVQEGTLFEQTVAENIAYPDLPSDPETILQTLQQIGQSHLADALENGLQTVYSPAAHTLSDGQIQLVLLARALLHRKRFLILDESMSHLDAQSVQTILRTLRIAAADAGVILVSHRSDDLTDADAVFWLQDGKIASPVDEADAASL